MDKKLDRLQLSFLFGFIGTAYSGLLLLGFAINASWTSPRLISVIGSAPLLLLCITGLYFSLSDKTDNKFRLPSILLNLLGLILIASTLVFFSKNHGLSHWL